MSALDNEMINFIRLNSVLLPRACCALRVLFRKLWQRSIGHKWNDSAEQGMSFAIGIGREVYEKLWAEKLKEKLRSGCVEDWDITILAHILLNFNFGSLNLSFNEQSIIHKILEVRNDLAHGNSRVSNEEFRCKWLQVETALVTFGDSQAELDELWSNNYVVFYDSCLPEARKQNNIGIEFLKKKQFADAALCFTKAIEMPNLPIEMLCKLYSNRSMAYQGLSNGDWDMHLLSLLDVEKSRDLLWEKSNTLLQHRSNI